MTEPRRLTPYEIRTRSFPTVRRQGLDPDQVRHYLRLVAEEVARLHRDLAAVSGENVRIKNHLRRWQTRQASWGGQPVDPQQLETLAYPTLPAHRATRRTR
jgi:DivIVA domain-containing protein